MESDLTAFTRSNFPWMWSAFFRNATFASDWGFKHRPGSPGHQQTNGKAEAAVKQAKSLLRKVRKTKRDLHWVLVLLALRNTPTDSMGTSLAWSATAWKILPNTDLSTTKVLLKPQINQAEVVKKETWACQIRQAKYYDQGAKNLPPLEEGDVVVIRMRPFRSGQKE